MVSMLEERGDSLLIPIMVVMVVLVPLMVDLVTTIMALVASMVETMLVMVEIMQVILGLVGIYPLVNSVARYVGHVAKSPRLARHCLNFKTSKFSEGFKC